MEKFLRLLAMSTPFYYYIIVTLLVSTRQADSSSDADTRLSSLVKAHLGHVGLCVVRGEVRLALGHLSESSNSGLGYNAPSLLSTGSVPAEQRQTGGALSNHPSFSRDTKG